MNITHKRLVAGTLSLNQAIEDMGFTLVELRGNGTKETREYRKDNKIIKLSHNSIILEERVNYDHLLVYKGLTVHDELLKFFSTRGLIKESL